jgi:hypothetical protein
MGTQEDKQTKPAKLRIVPFPTPTSQTPLGMLGSDQGKQEDMWKLLFKTVAKGAEGS